MASFALASLTENYTDSEGEEGHHHDVSPMSEDAEEAVTAKPSDSENSLPPIEKPVNNNTGLLTSSTVSNLVSYHDDAVLSEDEHLPEKITAKDEGTNASIKDYEVELPPDPQGRCSNELQDKISRLHEEMVLKGLDMNQLIQKRKDFRNPSIYEKLIQFCGINEFGTNYPPEMYDPLKWGKSSYYDELAKLQKVEMEQKEKERREKTKVEFLMGTAKKTSNSNSTSDEDAKKRKSKWDQVGSGSQAIVKPPGLLPLTSTATGTKGTVISAFGTLPKKPRI